MDDRWSDELSVSDVYRHRAVLEFCPTPFLFFDHAEALFDQHLSAIFVNHYLAPAVCSVNICVDLCVGMLHVDVCASLSHAYGGVLSNVCRLCADVACEHAHVASGFGSGTRGLHKQVLWPPYWQPLRFQPKTVLFWILSTIASNQLVFHTLNLALYLYYKPEFEAANVEIWEVVVIPWIFSSCHKVTSYHAAYYALYYAPYYALCSVLCSTQCDAAYGATYYAAYYAA